MIRDFPWFWLSTNTPVNHPEQLRGKGPSRWPKDLAIACLPVPQTNLKLRGHLLSNSSVQKPRGVPAAFTMPVGQKIPVRWPVVLFSSALLLVYTIPKRAT